MAARPPVTPALLDEYCRRFRNWGRWGDDDELGTVNFITPEVIRHAATLVRQGKVISCALPFDANGPQTGAFGRVNPIHSMVATGTDHVAGVQKPGGFDHAPYGWGYADDQITMFLQTGTQWDGLGHIFHHGLMYGGRDARLVSSRGAARNGIQHYKDRIVSRGVLLDVARFKGRDALEPGEPIYPEDLDGCAARQGSPSARATSCSCAPGTWAGGSASGTGARSRRAMPPASASTPRPGSTSGAWPASPATPGASRCAPTSCRTRSSPCTWCCS